MDARGLDIYSDDIITVARVIPNVMIIDRVLVIPCDFVGKVDVRRYP